MRIIKINCDKCNNDFQMDLKVKKLSKGIEETYFICPNCKEKYVSFRTDNKIRKLQGSIVSMRKEIAHINSLTDIPGFARFNKINLLSEEIEQIKLEIDKRMSELDCD